MSDNTATAHFANLYATCAERAETSEAMRLAREESEELGGNPPDRLTAVLLQVLAHTAHAKSAVYIGESPGVVALAVLSGMRAGGTVTALTSDPHHAQAGRNALKAAGYPASACRFISTRPLEVLGKLASGSYDLVIAQHGIVEPELLVTRGLELVDDGSVIVLGSISAFDELIADENAAAGSDTQVAASQVQRLPLGNGVSVLSTHKN